KTLGSRFHHSAPTSGDVVEGQPEKKNAASQKEHALYRVSPHHRVESAEQRIARSHHDNPHHDVILIPPGQFTHRNAPAIKNRGKEDQYVTDGHYHTINTSTCRSITALQEFRNGHDLIAQVHRNEKNHRQQIRWKRPPRPVCNPHSVLVSRPHGSYDLFTRHGGSNKSRPHQVPGHF